MNRRLVVNADDFGLSPGVNEGVIRAHRNGIVTSTSLMVRQPAAAEAAALARENPRLGVGLHVDVGEWRHDGADWVPVYARVDLDDFDEIAREVDAQLRLFEEIMRARPTHLDSHQHVHRRDPLIGLLLERADRLGVPVRHLTPDIRYEGRFYGQTDEGARLAGQVSIEALCQLIIELGPGVTELCCHPAVSADIDTAYRDERLMELAALCDPAARRTVADADVVLCTFAEAQR